MAVTPNSVVMPQAIGGVGQTLVNADSTNKKTLYTAGANGSVITGLPATTNDTSANNVALYVSIGGTDYLIGTVRVATLAGTDGAVVSRNLLNTTDLPFLKLDNAGNATLELPAAAILKAAVLVAVTAAKTLTIVALGEDF